MGLGGADGNLKDGSGFFKREVVLIVEKKDSSTGRRDEVKEGKECFVWQLVDPGVERGERFRGSRFEGLPAAGVFELREGNARGNSESPWAKDSRLAKEGKFAEDLNRSFLVTTVGMGWAGQTDDIAAQRRINLVQELLQGAPVAGLGEQDEEGLAGRGKLLGAHA